MTSIYESVSQNTQTNTPISLAIATTKTLLSKVHDLLEVLFILKIHPMKSL